MLIHEITHTLNVYRQATTKSSVAQSKEDYSRLAAITESVIVAMQAGAMTEVKLGALSLSRQVSDTFTIQQPEFKALARKIAEAKKRVI